MDLWRPRAKGKPPPEPVTTAPVIRALEKSLEGAREPALRERISRVLDRLRILYGEQRPVDTAVDSDMKRAERFAREQHPMPVHTISNPRKL